MEEQVQLVGLVIQRLLENKLSVKPDKCKFHSPAANFLGYVVAQGQLQSDPAKIRTLEEWPTPTSC